MTAKLLTVSGTLAFYIYFKQLVLQEALSWFNNYLSDRKQRVVLPSTSSDWAFIRAGVPQGSF